MVKIMKNLFFSMVILLSTSYCANAIATQGFERYKIEDMYTNPVQVFADEDGYFEITKRCLSEQKWRLKVLPENVILCGLFVTKGIWYQNNVVLGGPVTHDCHFRFKMNQNQREPVTIIFELLNVQNQVEKTFTTEVVPTPMVWDTSDGINEWLRRERELMLPVDEMPQLQPRDPFHKIYGTQDFRIDKKVLSSEIKRIIYMVFFQEMGIIGGDFADIAQGNADLTQDLKELFCVSFNSGDEIAQKALDEFCDKWGLEKIKISEAHMINLNQ